MSTKLQTRAECLKCDYPHKDSLVVYDDGGTLCMHCFQAEPSSSTQIEYEAVDTSDMVIEDVRDIDLTSDKDGSVVESATGEVII